MIFPSHPVSAVSAGPRIPTINPDSTRRGQSMHNHPRRNILLALLLLSVIDCLTDGS